MFRKYDFFLRFTSDLWKDSRNVVTPLQEYAPKIFLRDLRKDVFVRFKSYHKSNKNPA